MALGCVLAVSVSVLSRVTDAPAKPQGPQLGDSRPGITEPGHGAQKTPAVAGSDGLAACEQRLERTPRRVPVLAVVGASYTAGVGPGSPALSWAVQLARMLHWNAVIDGVPGAGYARAGAGSQGPVLRVLAREDLRALRPALVIVQAGHDDIGVPLWAERRQVAQAIAFIRAAAPKAQIGLLTVFTAGPPSPSAVRTDHAIVSAAITADSRVIVMDPLTGRWTFQHSHRGLHPTAAGDAWIARKLADILRSRGVPAAQGTSRPVTCDSGISVLHGPGKPVPPRNPEA
ncbi:MAG TPA: SGNH/GDSL hydrolase family protein [Trebonia sp.]